MHFSHRGSIITNNIKTTKSATASQFGKPTAGWQREQLEPSLRRASGGHRRDHLFGHLVDSTTLACVDAIHSGKCRCRPQLSAPLLLLLPLFICILNLNILSPCFPKRATRADQASVTCRPSSGRSRRLRPSQTSCGATAFEREPNSIHCSSDRPIYLTQTRLAGTSQ